MAYGHRKKKRFLKVLTLSGAHDWTHIEKNIIIKTRWQRNEMTMVKLNMMNINKQAIVHEYKHTSTQNDQYIMRLVESHLKKQYYYYWNLKKLQQYDVNILYFAPLQFSKQEWSVAP